MNSVMVVVPILILGRFICPVINIGGLFKVSIGGNKSSGG